MQDDFERQRILIEGENVNISETNVLKELVQISFNIILFIIVIYFSVFIVSGIVIKSLSIEKQIALENFMTKVGSDFEVLNIDKEYLRKINNIKNKILKYDTSFPKTSNLDVKVIRHKEMNALCLPNGNIYITSPLFDKIKENDDMLFFVLAHEMAHYKNKDHIMNLRKNISSGVILTILALGGHNQSDLNKIIENTINLSDLNYSRSVEARADKYAGKMLLIEYGNTKSGVRALELLASKHYPERFYIFSTHPTIEQRVKNLKEIERASARRI